MNTDSYSWSGNTRRIAQIIAEKTEQTCGSFGQKFPILRTTTLFCPRRSRRSRRSSIPPSALSTWTGAYTVLFIWVRLVVLCCSTVSLFFARSHARSQNPVIGVGAAAVSEHDRPDGQRNRNVLPCAAVPKYSPFHFCRLADSHFLRALEFSADLSASGAALGRISGNGAKAEEWTIAFTQRRDCSAC